MHEFRLTTNAGDTTHTIGDFFFPLDRSVTFFSEILRYERSLISCNQLKTWTGVLSPLKICISFCQREKFASFRAHRAHVRATCFDGVSKTWETISFCCFQFYKCIFHLLQCQFLVLEPSLLLQEWKQVADNLRLSKLNKITHAIQ